MATLKRKLKKNIAGFLDYQGIFHPIRSGNDRQGNFLPGYSPELAGDADDVFDKEIRREKNIKKAIELDEKRQMDAALDEALGDEKKISLSQFVRRSGGLKFDPKEKTNDRGELKLLSFKEQGAKGIAHKNGKNTLDNMREKADLAGYAGKDGLPLSTVNDFLTALDADLNGKRKIYPFGTIGAYKYNPSTKESFYKKVAATLKRVIEKLKKRRQTAKANKLERARKLAAEFAKTSEKPKVNTAKPKKNSTKKRTPAKKAAKKNTLRKNGLLTAATELALGTQAAIGIYDRLKPKKNVGKAKKNKGDAEYHEREFERLLVAIENGDFGKINSAKLQGRLSGHPANDVSRFIQSAKLDYWLKSNPTPATIKAAENLLLKPNSIAGRAFARYRAGHHYKRQLRLESAVERAKEKRRKQETKAKKNPVKKASKAKKNLAGGSKSFEAFHGRPSTKLLQLEVPEGAPVHNWTLGKLLELRLKGRENIDFRQETTGRDFYIVSDEGNKQIWIAGRNIKIATPNPEIRKGYSIPFAEITHVIYEAEKHHLGDTKPVGYIHKLGWETYQFRADKGLPTLSFDRDGCGIITGGSYTITPLGIAD